MDLLTWVADAVSALAVTHGYFSMFQFILCYTLLDGRIIATDKVIKLC